MSLPASVWEGVKLGVVVSFWQRSSEGGSSGD